MFRFKWASPKVVQSRNDLLSYIECINSTKPNITSFDTETTGLNIVADKPFLFQVSFANQGTREAFSFTIDMRNDKHLTEQFVLLTWQVAEKMDYVIGHNIGFDLHMMKNIGLPYEGTNITDTTIMIRIGSDAVPESRGGEPMGLTQYAFKHIDRNAKDYDKKLQAERSQIASYLNEPLKEIAKKNYIKWMDFQKLLNDDIYDISTLPKNIQRDYQEWFDKLPDQVKHNMRKGIVIRNDIPYNMLNIKNLHEYGAMDTVYPIEIFDVLEEVIKVRKNTEIWKRENELIPVLVRMEREGFQINKEYIEEIKEPFRKYIIKRRSRLSEIVGDEVTINQHAKIKETFKNKFGLEVASTGKEALKDLKSDLLESKKYPEAVELIELLQELRRLEKWYGTYLMRFYKEAPLYKSVYTQLNQAGAVTGRFTSDFQQFPNGGIMKDDGTELYTPRRMVQVPDKFDYLVFIDYSQIELRVQALYTILVGHPDKNLCRAYMPFDCYTLAGGERVAFDYKEPAHIQEFNKCQWFHNEDDIEWHPVDVHSATTKEAFPDVDPNSPEFKKLRGIGKSINFSKNYGASINVTRGLFKGDKTEEEIKFIDGAYYRAFPGVKEYQSYCYAVAGQGYMTNLFGRRYYNISGHNGMNALVQGSSADLLKEKMINIDKFISENKLKSRMIMTIHDELVFGMTKDEIHHVDDFVRIMQEFKGSLVPIVAEIEYTTTSWADLKEAQNASDID